MAPATQLPGTGAAGPGPGLVLSIDPVRSFLLEEESVFEGQLPSLESDADGNVVASLAATGSSFEADTLPLGGVLDIDDSTGRFTYRPATDFYGRDGLVYRSVDASGVTRTSAVEFVVANVPDAPQLSVDLSRVAEQDSIYNGSLMATDTDGGALVFSAENLPGWASLDSLSGRVTGLPLQQDVGIYRGIRFIVTDEDGLQAQAGPFAVEVLDINDSPTVNAEQFPSIIDAGDEVIVNLFPDDPDGDFVTLQTEPNDFASVEIIGGSLALTADEVTEVTDVNLVVIATDLLGSTTREIIPITIRPLTASGLGRTLRGRRDGWGVHLVVLGDGYKSDEVNTFDEDVEDFIALMERDPAIHTHFDAWNIHSIKIPSVDSGADDDFSSDVRDTAFDSGYFCQGLPRLICADTGKLFDVALDEYPNLDQIVLLVNDSRFGGSGGSVAIASASSPEIALHELGHSIAGLADEYVDSEVPEIVAGIFSEGRFANVSVLDDPMLVPWSHWIDGDGLASQAGDPRVGIFEGAFYQSDGFFRATSTSRMRDNTLPFGVVNGEQWALSVYRLAQPVLEISPLNQDVRVSGGDVQRFSVLPSFGQPVQRTLWYIDGEEITFARGLNTLSLLEPPGTYEVEVRVEDVSGRIRLPSPNASQFSWIWNLHVE